MDELKIEDIRKFMAEHECGLLEARRLLRKQAMINAVKAAKSVDDLRDVILALIEGGA